MDLSEANQDLSSVAVSARTLVPELDELMEIAAYRAERTREYEDQIAFAEIHATLAEITRQIRIIAGGH